MGLAADLVRDKRAKGPLGEDASSLISRLERRALLLGFGHGLFRTALCRAKGGRNAIWGFFLSFFFVFEASARPGLA